MSDTDRTPQDKDPRVFEAQGVLSFPHLARPDNFGGKGEATYRLQLVADRADFKGPVTDAIKAAVEDKWPSESERPKLDKLKMLIAPLREEDTDTFDGLDDPRVLKLSSTIQPTLWNPFGEEVDPMDAKAMDKWFYPGAVVRARGKTYGWDNVGGKGVSAFAVAVQHVEDGPRIGARVDATFGAVRKREDEPMPKAKSVDDIL